MTKNKRPIIRIKTGSEINDFIDREMNDEEFEQHLKDVEEFEAQKSQADAKAAAKQAILDRLGLTADEAKLILG